MDVHLLRFFCSVAENRSFFKASSQLHISQPMVSKGIKQLEKDLGVKLIERPSKRFALTDAGERLYILSKDIINRFDNVAKEFSDVREANSGKVTLAGPPLSFATYFPNILKLMHNRYPGIQISVLASGSKTTVELICDNKADIGISQLPVQSDAVDIYPIIHDKCVLLVSEHHPFASKKRISVSQLKNECFISLGQGFVMHDTLKEICQEFGFNPNIIFNTTLISFAEHLVSLNEGIAILPRPLVDTYRPSGICMVELEEYLPWDIAVIVSNKHHHSIATTKALELILEYFLFSKNKNLGFCLSHFET